MRKTTQSTVHSIVINNRSSAKIIQLFVAAGGPNELVTGSSTEADGNVKYVPDGPSSISLRVAAASSPVRLEEHEVVCRHHSG